MPNYSMSPVDVRCRLREDALDTGAIEMIAYDYNYLL